MSNIRNADDTADLQYFMTRLVQSSEQYGFILNIDKTKYMIIKKGTIGISQFIVNNKQIKRMTYYNYLGSIIDKITRN